MSLLRTIYVYINGRQFTDYDGDPSLPALQISMIMANEVSINPNYNTR